MVLAAGLGLRLRPLTLLRAKPALPVMNRPLIAWILEGLRGQGIREVMVNLHHRPASVRRAVRGVRGLRVRFSLERRLLGTGGGPRRVRRWLGPGACLVVNGDVLLDGDLARLLDVHARRRAPATLGLLPLPPGRGYSRVVTGPSGEVRSLGGLPQPGPGRSWLFTGLHVLDPALLEMLPPGPSDSVRDLYAPLVAVGWPPRGVALDGAWYDFGSPARYLESHRALLGRGFAGARDGRLVAPGARIHPRAEVVESVVGPGSAVAAGARVRGSVLWDRVQVGEGAEVRDSVVTSGVRVEARQALARAVLLRPTPARAREPGARLWRGRLAWKLT
jgi:NDP-sugar pyrophosphorylase family protein